MQVTRIRKILFVLLAAFALSVDCAWGVVIENVRARQIPQTREVEVYYDLIAPEGGAYEVTLQVKSAEVTPPVVTLSGDVGANCASGKNRRIIWDVAKDWHGHIATNFTATVTATFTRPIPKGMVRIPGLDIYMDKTEVTYEHWKKVYDWAVKNGYDKMSFSNSFSNNVSKTITTGKGKADDHPVHSVSYDDCVIWCNARSVMEGLEPVYGMNRYGDISEGFYTYRDESGKPRRGNGYRLPSLAEWVYAARGGLKDKLYPWGDEPPSHTYANCSANIGYLGNGVLHPAYKIGEKPYTSPVGSFLSNGYGLYDMAGNVMEHCEQIVYPSHVFRYLRGGSWDTGDYYLRFTTYIQYGGNYTDETEVGFRCVRNIK